MFRTWLPLLVALQFAAPGTARLLSSSLAREREKKTIDDPVRAAAADAWLWLIKSRYWHSLFDCLSLLHREGVGLQGEGGAAVVQLLLTLYI